MSRVNATAQPRLGQNRLQCIRILPTTRCLCCILCVAYYVSNVAGGVAGMVTSLAEQTFQKMSSNIGKFWRLLLVLLHQHNTPCILVDAEVQTQAVLQLSNAMNSSLRATRSTQFVYTPSNASSLRDPNFKLELIKVSSSSNSAHEPQM